MTNIAPQLPIIAGHFVTLEQAAHAEQALHAKGHDARSISVFYVNPPGQHDVFPIGGDRSQSPGAKQTVMGLAAGGCGGAAIGAAVGALGFSAAGVVAPLLGGLVGAHLGVLVGSLASTKQRGEIGRHERENAEPVRKSGVIVAVCIDNSVQESATIETLRELGATRIERAKGVIRDSDWVDFDPLSHPDYVQPPLAL